MPPIKVKVNPNKLDTLLYKGFNRSKFDTIICNISEAKKYRFYFNECCGAFNLEEQSTEGFIIGKVIYSLKSPDRRNTYLGTLGEAGVLISKQISDTLEPACRSAMSPNVYNVTFRQIEICKDSIHCGEGVCLKENDIDYPDWGFEYQTVSIKTDFLFMPLKSDPLLIIYDPKTNAIEIQ